jgi:nucleotide-binding universal stress UspA family protein
MYRVLMAVDENEQQASDLATTVERLAGEINDLEVLVLHVFRDVDLPSQVVVYEPLGDFQEEHHQQREIPAAVTNVADRLTERGIDAEIRIERSENPATTINSIAVDHNVDNILIGGRKQSPIGKVLFGSTTQAVLLNSNIPVTVAGTLN